MSPKRKSAELTAEALMDRTTLTATGCREWTGQVNSGGYGHYRGQMTHRLSWKLHRGPIPDGQVVRHLVCDNPPCINPDHLALGSPADNAADKRGKPQRSREQRRQLYYMLHKVGFPDPETSKRQRTIFPRAHRLLPLPHLEAPEALITEIDQLRAENHGVATRNTILVWLAILGLRSLERRPPQMKLLLLSR